MAEYASKGMSGTALGLGIAGTVGLVNQMTNGNGLGGLFGGNNNYVARGAEYQYVSQLQAENAGLKSERYADEVGRRVYESHLAELNRFKEGAFGEVAREAASNRERVAVLEAQIKCENEKRLLEEKLIDQKIDRVADNCACGINNLNNSIANINARLGGITQTVVPIGAVCPQPMPLYNSWEQPLNPATK